MQAVLLTFTNIRGDRFEQATTAILDMSSALGTSLQSAAIQVGKALNDPLKGVSALAEAGIQFTDQQKAQIKAMVETGDVAGAQAIILKELETQFGGVAEAMAKTPAGQWAQAMNALGDALEHVGQVLTPYVLQAGDGHQGGGASLPGALARGEGPRSSSSPGWPPRSARS